MSFRCGICGGPTVVIDSRWHEATESVRRRRKCQICSLRQTTYETEKVARVVKISQPPPQIIYDRPRAEHPRVWAALRSVRKKKDRVRSKNRINHLRNQLEQLFDKGLSIAEIAQRADLSQSTLYDFLNLRTPDKNLHRKTERKLVEAFSDFVSFVEFSNPPDASPDRRSKS